MGLTPKQERFARLVALEGLSQSQAYRQAYNVRTTKQASVWRDASLVAHNPKVISRVRELRGQLQAEAMDDATRVLAQLAIVGYASVPAEEIRPADKIAALDKMAKILGLYRDSPNEAPLVPITRVTIVLNHGPGGTSAETHQVIDGTGRILEPYEEERSK